MHVYRYGPSRVSPNIRVYVQYNIYKLSLCTYVCVCVHVYSVVYYGAKDVEGALLNKTVMTAAIYKRKWTEIDKGSV